MKIYVGNLSFQATEDEVRDLFEEYGEISSIAWITDRDTGRFRGFAFLEMPNEEEANSAIAALDGTDHHGRDLRVNQAVPRTDRRDRSNRGGGGNRGGGSSSIGSGNSRW